MPDDAPMCSGGNPKQWHRKNIQIVFTLVSSIMVQNNFNELNLNPFSQIFSLLSSDQILLWINVWVFCSQWFESSVHGVGGSGIVARQPDTPGSGEHGQQSSSTLIGWIVLGSSQIQFSLDIQPIGTSTAENKERKQLVRHHRRPPRTRRSLQDPSRNVGTLHLWVQKSIINIIKSKRQLCHEYLCSTFLALETFTQLCEQFFESWTTGTNSANSANYIISWLLSHSMML